MYVDEGERYILPNELEARGAFHIVILAQADSECRLGESLVRPIELSADSGYSATWTIGILGGHIPIPIEILD
jgi:hypothetical protein